MKSRKISLDATDHKILEILRENARASYTSISQKVSLSTPAVLERIRRLEENGVILGYRTEVDNEKTGYPIHAFILIKQDKYIYGIPKILSGIEAISSFWMVSGEYDYLLEVFLETTSDLNDLLEELYKIGRTYTMMCLNKLQNDSLKSHKEEPSEQ